MGKDIDEANKLGRLGGQFVLKYDSCIYSTFIDEKLQYAHPGPVSGIVKVAKLYFCPWRDDGLGAGPDPWRGHFTTISPMGFSPRQVQYGINEIEE